jgi:CheY-like chemotaxis protein
MATTDSDDRSQCRGRILVAEDDHELRRILVESLRRDRHEIHDVGDGASLLVELARNNYFHYHAVDAVVADIRMPLCSGLQAAAAARSIRRDLPFVLLSAFADPDAHARARALDAVLLEKPVSMDELRRVVADVIARTRGQLPSPSRSSIR